jgi:ferredoxin
MQVAVSKTHCQGHTMCNMAAPELFKLDEEDGHAYVDSPDVPADLEDLARAGMEACPEQAIEIRE